MLTFFTYMIGQTYKMLTLKKNCTPYFKKQSKYVVVPETSLPCHRKARMVFLKKKKKGEDGGSDRRLDFDLGLGLNLKKSVI